MRDDSATKSLEREQPTSTVYGGQDSVGAPGHVTPRDLRRARAFRRIILLLLLAFLVLGALNFFGVRRGRIQVQNDPYQLQVSYPRTGRPGIGGPIEIQVQRQGGFDGPVTIALSKDYLDVLAVRSVDPSPSKATATDTDLVWEFDPPPGDTLSVSLNAEFEPDEHPGAHDGRISVVDNGKPAVQARFTTWEAP